MSRERETVKGRGQKKRQVAQKKEERPDKDNVKVFAQ